MDEMIKGEKLRCVGRKVSKPSLIVQTGRHNAIEIFIDGKSAVAEVVKTWRVLK